MSANENVMQTLVPATDGPLLAWLLDALRPMSRSSVKELLRHGRVTVNGKAITQFDHLLRAGDQVALRKASPVAARAAFGLPIIAMDEHWLVLDKPAGLLSVATEKEKTDTAFSVLNAHLKETDQGRPFVVHRLDRETSGLLLFARSAEMRDRFQTTWESVTKTYLAVVEGNPRVAEGVIENDLVEGHDLRVRVCGASYEGAKRAISKYRVVKAGGQRSLVEIVLITGRKHQIRVHMSGLGHPVVGDKIYGAKSDPIGRLALHAHQLSFDHPVDGKRIEVRSPLPTDLKRSVG